MTNTTDNTYQVTYAKGDSRYYIHLDGEKMGWVSKSSDGGWKVWACLTDTIQGTVIGWDDTRKGAVEDALSTLAYRYNGWIVRLSFEHDDTYMKDVPFQFDTDMLRATARHMSYKRWGGF